MSEAPWEWWKRGAGWGSESNGNTAPRVTALGKRGGGGVGGMAGIGKESTDTPGPVKSATRPRPRKVAAVAATVVAVYVARRLGWRPTILLRECERWAGVGRGSSAPNTPSVGARGEVGASAPRSLSPLA